jgi:hypothetical protein
MVTLTTGIMFLPFTCMHFSVWEILRRRSACVPTDYEVVRDCRKFEKHWLTACVIIPIIHNIIVFVLFGFLLHSTIYNYNYNQSRQRAF